MQTLNRLNARKIASIEEPGRYADGGNLYFFISPNGGRRWTFKFRWDGKEKEIGLGSAKTVSLAQARELAAERRAQMAAGIEPKSPSASRRPSKGRTFGEVADALVEAMKPGWRSSIHAKQWEMTLREYAAPLRPLKVDDITEADVLGVLKPLWSTIPETAVRLRARIERVLDKAKVAKNPARWRGGLEHELPRRRRIAKPHHAAMPYLVVPKFMDELRRREGTAARCLEFVILTAARSNEVLGMRFGEIQGSTWTVPKERMKGGREHVVPLSRRAVEIIEGRPAGEFCFAGPTTGGPLRRTALGEVLKALAPGMTVHGFRSSFRDWAGDTTPYPRDIVEAALAHALRDHTEAAYRRSTALEKRRELMTEWARYCGQFVGK